MVISIKTAMEYVYPALIVFGALLGPLGLAISSPWMSGIGNAMFFAGIFTPMLILMKVTTKDAIFGGIWSATIAYFWWQGSVDGLALLLAIPLLVVSITATVLSGCKLAGKSD